eukprot:gene37468-49015_t
MDYMNLLAQSPQIVGKQPDPKTKKDKSKKKKKNTEIDQINQKEVQFDPNTGAEIQRSVNDMGLDNYLQDNTNNSNGTEGIRPMRHETGKLTDNTNSTDDTDIHMTEEGEHQQDIGTDKGDRTDNNRNNENRVNDMNSKDITMTEESECHQITEPGDPKSPGNTELNTTGKRAKCQDPTTEEGEDEADQDQTGRDADAAIHSTIPNSNTNNNNKKLRSGSDARLLFPGRGGGPGRAGRGVTPMVRAATPPQRSNFMSGLYIAPPPSTAWDGSRTITSSATDTTEVGRAGRNVEYRIEPTFTKANISIIGQDDEQIVTRNRKPKTPDSKFTEEYFMRKQLPPIPNEIVDEFKSRISEAYKPMDTQARWELHSKSGMIPDEPTRDYLNACTLEAALLPSRTMVISNCRDKQPPKVDEVKRILSNISPNLILDEEDFQMHARNSIMLTDCVIIRLRQPLPFVIKDNKELQLFPMIMAGMQGDVYYNARNDARTPTYTFQAIEDSKGTQLATAPILCEILGVPRGAASATMAVMEAIQKYLRITGIASQNTCMVLHTEYRSISKDPRASGVAESVVTVFWTDPTKNPQLLKDAKAMLQLDDNSSTTRAIYWMGVVVELINNSNIYNNPKRQRVIENVRQLPTCTYITNISRGMAASD